MEHNYHKQDFLAQNDTNALNNLITDIFPKCLGIAQRYCKTDEQANEFSKTCFISALKEMLSKKDDEFSDTSFLKQYIICIVKTLLSQRTGVLVADTTIVSVFKKPQSNLFTNSDYYKTLSPEEIIQHIRKLNVLQQIIFNMIVLDDFTISEAADIVQHNELSIKALIEKAKYNLYSSIKSIV